MRSSLPRTVGLVALGVIIGWGVPGLQAVGSKDPKRVDPPRIGYVNIAKVMRDYERSKQERTAIEKRREEFEEKFKAGKAEIERIQKEWQATRDPMARRARQEQALGEQRRIEATDTEATQVLTKMSNTAAVDAYGQIQTVLAELAKARCLDVIEVYPGTTHPKDGAAPSFATSMLQTPALMPFYLRPELDVTDEVIERLNKKFPAKP